MDILQAIPAPQRAPSASNAIMSTEKSRAPEKAAASSPSDETTQGENNEFVRELDAAENKSADTPHKTEEMAEDKSNNIVNKPSSLLLHILNGVDLTLETDEAVIVPPDASLMAEDLTNIAKDSAAMVVADQAIASGDASGAVAADIILPQVTMENAAVIITPAVAVATLVAANVNETVIEDPKSNLLTDNADNSTNDQQNASSNMEPMTVMELSATDKQGIEITTAEISTSPETNSANTGLATAVASSSSSTAAAVNNTSTTNITADNKNIQSLYFQNGNAQLVNNTIGLNPQPAPAASLPAAVEQVTLHLQRQAREGSEMLTLQLRPPELGRVEVKLEFGDAGTVSGIITADNPATLEALSRDQSGLQRALQDAGLRVDEGSLQFNLRHDQSGGQQQQQTWHQGNQSSDGSYASPYQNADNPVVTFDTAAMAENGYYVLPDRVNIRI